MSTSIPTGRVVFEGEIPSGVLQTNRRVRVYLPASYDHAPGRRYPVLYVQDGQNAFSTAGDHVAFGWGNWGLDQSVNELAAQGRMAEIIMVAIDCSAARYQEYRGPAYPRSASVLARSSRSKIAQSTDRRFLLYSRFLINELKPQVDAKYRTLPGPERTGLLGSSMGGICSLVLAWMHPRTFGLAASLSGAFQVERRNFLVNTLRQHEGRFKPIRIYLDSGVLDYGGGDDGRKDTAAVARELTRIGWKPDKNLLHFVDDHLLHDEELAQLGMSQHKWAEARTSQHNELYWRVRAWRPLTFMFPPV